MTLTPKRSGRLDGPFHFRFRGVVSAHCVDSNGDHVGGWLLLLDFHYFAALVLSAMRAHPVRQFGLMAVGAFGHPRRFQRIVRAAILVCGARSGVVSDSAFRYLKEFTPELRGFKVFSGLSALQSGPAAAGVLVVAIARRFIAVLAADGTDPLAILAADPLHGHAPAGSARAKYLPTPSRRPGRSPVALRLRRSRPLPPAR